MFEIPAGGRRYQALALLVKQKRLAKTAPVPCVVRDPQSTIMAEEGMTLEQLMAFTVNPDHERQTRVWEAVKNSWSKEPYLIRRMLTETAIRASDRRATFVGMVAYEAAGGQVLRDLFQGDDGGWLQDPALLDRLVAGKLRGEAETIATEGWKWMTARRQSKLSKRTTLPSLITGRFPTCRPWSLWQDGC